MDARNHRSGSRAGAAIVGCVLLLAATLAGCVTGEGPVTSETREIRPFSRLEVGAGIHVVMTVGPAEHLEVSAQANILDAVAANVSGRVLKINAERDFTSTEPVTVTLTGPTLDQITTSGGAQAVVTGVDVDALQINANGGSIVTVSGTATAVRLTADGGAKANLADLAATTVDLGIDGAATATLTAGDLVTGRASGGAEISVGGDALVTVNADGGAVVVRR
jgi:Putative auto-transporter adhesin, head GIN domain